MNVRHSRTERAWSRLACVVLLGPALTGCAMANRENRVLLNMLDQKMRPKTTWERAALAPLMIPVATGALLVDGLVLHPSRVAPQAADDVYELYWEPKEETLFRQSLLFIPRVLLTPPTFLGAWHLRSTYDIENGF